MSKFISIIKAHTVFFGFFLVFLDIVITKGLFFYHNFYHCFSLSNCKTLNSSAVFFISTTFFLALLGFYLYHLKSSKYRFYIRLITILFPLLIIVYIAAIYIAFNSFIRVTPSYLEINTVGRVGQGYKKIPWENIKKVEVRWEMAGGGRGGYRCEGSYYIILNTRSEYFIGFKDKNSLLDKLIPSDRINNEDLYLLPHTPIVEIVKNNTPDCNK